jgi:quercetin dioxygenase-like cupin family protein
MSTFLRRGDVAIDQFDWGTVGWRCRPTNTGSRHIVVMEVTLAPGGGHDFHRHPGQEELIVVREGTITQFLESEWAELGPGDSVYIDADIVHASFNATSEQARVFVVLGPALDAENGYGVVDVYDQEPWASIERPGKEQE